MELNEFKDMFNETSDQSLITKPDVSAMIYQNDKGPLAAFEKNLKFTLFIFPLVVILFTGYFFYHVDRPLTWYLLYFILFMEFLFSLFQYGIVKKIKQNTGSVKDNLMNKLVILQNTFKWFSPIYELLFVCMAVLLEVEMYRHSNSNFDGWSNVNPVLRITFYVVFITSQYFLKRKSLKKHYTQYLEQLQQLAEQL